MPDLSGGLLLSGDLAFYRVMDAFNANRTERAANADVAQAWAVTDEMQRQLNLVIDAYNKLLREAQTYDANYTRRFATMEQRIGELERENTELRRQNGIHEHSIRDLLKERSELLAECGEARWNLRQAKRRIAEFTGENQE